MNRAGSWMSQCTKTAGCIRNRITGFLKLCYRCSLPYTLHWSNLRLHQLLILVQYICVYRSLVVNEVCWLYLFCQNCHWIYTHMYKLYILRSNQEKVYSLWRTYWFSGEHLCQPKFSNIVNVDFVGILAANSYITFW